MSYLTHPRLSQCITFDLCDYFFLRALCLIFGSLLATSTYGVGEYMTTTSSELWNGYVADPDNHSHIPNVSYAGYKRGEVPIPDVPTVVTVTDFGAVGDGITDNSVAFRNAIRAAHESGGGAVYVPAGNFAMADPLHLRYSGVSLKGAGMGQTILTFTRALGESVGSLNPNSTNIWSWTGGLVWVGPDDATVFAESAADTNLKVNTRLGQGYSSSSNPWEYWRFGSVVASVTNVNPRGDDTIKVDDASGLTPGELVLMTYDNTPEFDLFLELHPDELFKTWNTDNWGSWFLPENYPRWIWAVEIESISGNQVKLAQPLRVSTQSIYNVSLRKNGRIVEEVGVEDLSIQLDGYADGVPYDFGWNGLFLQRAFNCWVRNVEVLDGNNGFHVTSSKNCSLINTTVKGDRYVHHPYTNRCMSADILYENFEIDITENSKGGTHGINTEFLTSGNVWSKGTMNRGTFDTHRGMAFDMVRTEITLRNEANSNPGGSAKAGPYAGQRMVNWNVSVNGSDRLPDTTGAFEGVDRRGLNVYQPELHVNGALVGITGVPIAPHPAWEDNQWCGVMPCGDKGVLVADEGQTPHPANLYDAQVSLRTNSEKWIHVAEPNLDFIPFGSTTQLIAAANAASDSVDSVTFYIDGTAVHTDSDAPFTHDWTPQPGLYELELSMTDSSGATLWTPTPKQIGVGQVIPMDENHPNVTVSGAWDRGPLVGEWWLGGEAAYNFNNNDYLEFSFQGTRFEFYSSGETGHSVRFDVRVNGNLVVDGKNIRQTGGVRYLAYDSGWMPNGNYTVRIQNRDRLVFDRVVVYSTTGGSVDTLPPAAPTQVLVTGVNATSLSLDWEDNSENDLDSYVIYRSLASGSGYQSIASGVTTSSYTDAGLSSDTDYFYVIKAQDSSGNRSAYSNEASARTALLNDNTPPDAPTGLVSTASTSTSAVLNWDDSDESDFSHYAIYRSTTSGSGYSVIETQVANSNYTETGLAPETTYYYVVRAVDTSGNESVNGNEVQLTTTAAPTGGYFVQDDTAQGIVSLEAENYKALQVGNLAPVWTVVDDAGASDGQVMRTLADTGNSAGNSHPSDSPRADYDIEFVKSGTHYIWVRSGLWQGGSSDSVYVGFSDGSGERFDMGSDRVWSNTGSAGVPVTLDVPSAGVYTLSLWMREDGSTVDKLLVTTDASYVPSEAGPDETVVLVNTPPDAVDDSMVTDQDAAVSVDVLANDTDLDTGDVLSVQSYTQGTHGSVSALGTSLVYAPNAGYFGPDSFTYVVTDGIASDTATVSLTVLEAPSGTGAFLQDSGVDGLLVIEAENFDANISRDGKHWVTYGTVRVDLNSYFEAENYNEKGILNVAGGGELGATGIAPVSYMRVEPDTGSLVNSGYATSTAELRYRVNFSQTGTHYLWIRGYNTGGDDDSLHLGLNGAETSTSDRFNLRNNGDWAWSDSTMDGVATIDITTTGEHTLNIWMREDGARFDKIVLTTNSNYDPTSVGALGPDESPRSGIVNSVPMATDDSAVTDQDVAVMVDVLDNDSDADVDDELSVLSYTQGTNGTVSALGASLIYTPDAAFFGEDIFTYTISDGLEAATATVTITVNEVVVGNIAGFAYALEEGSGTTTESTDGGPSASLVGQTAWVDGYQGGGLEFARSGLADYLETNSEISVDKGSGYTAMMWVRPTDLSGTGFLALSQQLDGTGTGRSWLFLDSSRRISSFVGGMGTYGSSVLNEDTWYHVAMTIGSGTDATLTLYVNGVVEATSTQSLESNRAAFRFGMFKTVGDSGNQFVGTLDDIRLINESLTAAEIQTIASEGPDNGAINQEPVAHLTAFPSAGEAPLQVVFDASGSSDPDGDSLSFSWDFGDGSTAVGATPSHTYPVAGVYHATLTVSDSSGFTSTASLIITATEPLSLVFEQDAGADGLLVMEAENAMAYTAGSYATLWTEQSDANASGGVVMVASPDSGLSSGNNHMTESPMGRFDVEFHQPGLHYLWARSGAWGGGAGDSIFVGLNGEKGFRVDMSRGYEWFNQSSNGIPIAFDVPTAGRYTLNLWMREDGVKVDKLLLTTNAQYVPRDTGPEESALGVGSAEVWYSVDIGNVGTAGASAYDLSTGIFSLSASGNGLGGSTDALHYVYKEWTQPDIILKARIESMNTNNGSPLAGLMLRQSDSADAKQVFLGADESGAAQFVWRESAGGSTTSATLAGQQVPYWVSLEKNGDLISAFVSPDGVEWTQVGTSATVSFAEPFSYGLASSSGLEGTLGNATFSEVSAEESSGAYSVMTSSYLGGASDDVVVSSLILSDGTVLLAGNLSGSTFGGVTPRLLHGAVATDEGVVLRLSSNGQTVQDAVRVGGLIHEMVSGPDDTVYVAAGPDGLVKLPGDLSNVNWSKSSSSAYRVDVGENGDVVLLEGTGQGNGNVKLYNAGGTELNNFAGFQRLNDVAINSALGQVYMIGFENKNTSCNPVQIAFLRSVLYDGTEVWRNYTWNQNLLEPGCPDSSVTINNMADTRGYRVMYKDGTLYALFESAGGNDILRWEPKALNVPISLEEYDPYSQFTDSTSEHKTVIMTYDPATGDYILGTRLTARLENGSANACRINKGNIAVDDAGRIYVSGNAASGGGLNNTSLGLPFTFNPLPDTVYGGGAYLLILPPEMNERLFLGRVTGDASSNAALSVRKVNGNPTPTILIGGETSGADKIVYKLNALERAPNGGKDGFFTLIREE